MQDDALCRKFLFDRTRHVCPRLICTRTKSDRGSFVSRIVPPLASEGRMVTEMPKNMAACPQIKFFRDVAAVAAQWSGE
jgi:hypothetical protein